MSRLELLCHSDPDAVVARRHGEEISVRRFLADAARLAAALPDTGHIIHGCGDRYRFALGLAACLMSGRVSLLPPSHAAKTLELLADFAPDAVILCDSACGRLALPVMQFPELGAPGPGRGSDGCEVPLIESERLAAWVFTSGSTGTPQPHAKHWGAIKRNVTNAARVLGLSPQRPATLVGTVPPQHMYGFESTVLLAWQSGAAFDAGRPFFPADIVATLAASPAPTVLVTTPYHLNAILESGIQPPPIALVLCATAPLSARLAERAETAFGAPLIEIYGSTETGQIATRRTCREETWILFPEVELIDREGQTWAEGGHVEVGVPLGDVIERQDPRRFLLKGRHSDLINIAGKRTSLGWLNQQLLSIPRVQDGGFYLPDCPNGGEDAVVTRLTAFVVAPGLDSERLMAALRERLDPIFLPRPLIFVDALPRTAVGKLPRADCELLLKRYTQGTRVGS